MVWRRYSVNVNSFIQCLLYIQLYNKYISFNPFLELLSLLKFTDFKLFAVEPNQKKKGLCILKKKTNFFLNLEYSELCSLESNEFFFPSLLGKLLVVNKQELWGYFWARVSKPHKEIFKLICSHDTQPSFSLKIDIWEINKVSFLLVFLFYKHLWKN